MEMSRTIERAWPEVTGSSATRTPSADLPAFAFTSMTFACSSVPFACRAALFRLSWSSELFETSSPAIPSPRSIRSRIRWSARAERPSSSAMSEMSEPVSGSLMSAPMTLSFWVSLSETSARFETIRAIPGPFSSTSALRVWRSSPSAVPLILYSSGTKGFWSFFASCSPSSSERYRPRGLSSPRAISTTRPPRGENGVTLTSLPCR